jgi:hypothetical protein
LYIFQYEQPKMLILSLLKDRQPLTPFRAWPLLNSPLSCLQAGRGEGRRRRETTIRPQRDAQRALRLPILRQAQDEESRYISYI